MVTGQVKAAEIEADLPRTWEEARPVLAAELAEVWGDIKMLRDDIKELRARTEAIRDRIPEPVYPGNGYTSPPCGDPVPQGGGSRMDKPLFGFDPGFSMGSMCTHCGEPASKHGCPEVK